MDVQPDNEITQEYSDTKEIPEKENPIQKLFLQKVVTLPELLQIPNLRESLNQLEEDLTEKLFERQNLLKQVLDCALRPHILKEYNIQIQWPYRAVEFIIKQQQSFFKKFFIKKSMQVEGEEEQKENTRIEVEGTNILYHLFLMLDEPAPVNETSAGYLLQIFNQLYYSNQKQCFYFFVDFREFFEKAINHFYNHSIEELLWRVIDTFNEDVKSKAELMNQLFRGVLVERKNILGYLQNLDFIVDNLIQRCDEMNSKKIASLLSQEIISSTNLELIRGIAQKYSDSKSILKALSSIIINFIRLYLPPKPLKKKMYYMDEEFQLEKIGQQILKDLIVTVKQMVDHWLKNITEEKKQEKSIQPGIRLLHYILQLSPQAVDIIINESHKDLIPILIKRQPNNNILHNQIKYCILIILNSQNSASIIIPSLVKFILQNYPEERLYPKPTYLNQLFHIIPIIHQKVHNCQLNVEVLQKWNHFISNDYTKIKQNYDTTWSKLTMSPAKKSFEMQQELISSDEFQLEQIKPFKRIEQEKVGKQKQQNVEVEEVESVFRVEFSPTMPVELNDEQGENVVGAGGNQNSPQ